VNFARRVGRARRANLTFGLILPLPAAFVLSARERFEIVSRRRVLASDRDAREFRRGGGEFAFRTGDTIRREGGVSAGQIAGPTVISDQGPAIEDGLPPCNWAKAGQSLGQGLSSTRKAIHLVPSNLTDPI
jgi:hypothetical protein